MTLIKMPVKIAPASVLVATTMTVLTVITAEMTMTAITVETMTTKSTLFAGTSLQNAVTR